MGRIRYKFCDCGFCPAIFDTKEEAHDFKEEYQRKAYEVTRIGIQWTYSVRRIKAGWVVYYG